MFTSHNTTAKRLIAALGAAAAASVSALLIAGAGTAQADDSCYGGVLQGSYYCSPASGSGTSSQPGLQYSPSQPAFGYNNLPGCSGGALPALTGALSGEGC
jgi:uncharacterized membrane protein